ncbi:hypothetical protein ACERII_25400 [Evansella sp. AB-rgal1]|uniref:hypothetical protein n=1 Tax=Evansella sp. AB-rgal1 TaxID=3242696 RepID=UPI00359EA19B
MDKSNKTIVGTNINEVKKLNSNSGLTYNQAKIMLVKKENIYQLTRIKALTNLSKL